MSTITLILSLILILIIIIFIFLLYLIKNLVNKNNNAQTEITTLKEDFNKTIGLLNNNINQSTNSINQQLSQRNIEVGNTYKNISDTLDKKIANQTNILDGKLTSQNNNQLNTLKYTVNELETKLKQQAELTNKQVKEVIERVSSLDNIKSQMSDLNINITNLEKILNDKKLRGTFGELRLLSIFEAIFGENKTEIYEEQYLLSNGKRVDFILKAPYPIGNLPIDSKFPLENYVNITKANTDEALKEARKNFKQDIKKHINDIATKYILENETSTQAMMFIPAEAIFAYLYANEEEIIQYSYEKKVWITSPTTIIAILNLLQVVLKDVKRNESYDLMYSEILKLKKEFERYETRWNNLYKHLETVVKDVKEVDVTSKKISKKFDDIENVNLKVDN
ncbi:MAG: DNA recombination protein RmuC [Mycoplasmatales bacterium]